jgi:hypothetical protein
MSDTAQLMHWMRYKNDFIGVFARDQLQSQYEKSFEGCLIFNTDTANLRGKHWVAIQCREGTLKYFDSFGFPPSACLYNKFLKFNVEFNRKQCQSFLSDLCGHHCVYYLYQMYPAENDFEAELYINKFLK